MWQSKNKKETKYAVQVRRQEIVDHIIEQLDQVPTTSLSNQQKSTMVENMMQARELPPHKQDNIYYALMISMHADDKLLKRKYRNKIQQAMKQNGISGRLKDIVTLESDRTVKVLTG